MKNVIVFQEKHQNVEVQKKRLKKNINTKRQAHNMDERLSFDCTNCDRKFKIKKKLTFHVQNECGKIFVCEECHKEYKSKHSLGIVFFTIFPFFYFRLKTHKKH